jgi:putative RNA 2'-phosphotransferase
VNKVELSKSMAYALRHHPEEFGLKPDERGWVRVEDLAKGLRAKPEDISAIVAAQTDKIRYEEMNGFVRAVYGHSFPVRYEPDVPPDILYHGSPTENEESIFASGILPMSRYKVCLSDDVDTALAVGHRRSDKVSVFKVDAKRANAAGIRFYKGTLHTWMSDPIPSEFIIGAERK